MVWFSLTQQWRAQEDGVSLLSCDQKHRESSVEDDTRVDSLKKKQDFAATGGDSSFSY